MISFKPGHQLDNRYEANGPVVLPGGGHPVAVATTSLDPDVVAAIVETTRSRTRELMSARATSISKGLTHDSWAGRNIRRQERASRRKQS